MQIHDKNIGNWNIQKTQTEAKHRKIATSVKMRAEITIKIPNTDFPDF